MKYLVEVHKNVIPLYHTAPSITLCVGFEAIYKKLGVTCTERGESFYQPLMPEVVKDLEAKGHYYFYQHRVQCICAGLLKEDQGSKVVFLPGHDMPLMVVKSDGAFTYDTSDLAALRHRVVDEKGDWLIYVVDSGQVKQKLLSSAC